MREGREILAKMDRWGNLICKGCSDKYCVTIHKDESVFCPSYVSSAYDGKHENFTVQCIKKENQV